MLRGGHCGLIGVIMARRYVIVVGGSGVQCLWMLGKKGG